MQTGLRAVIYGRVSTEEQAENGTSLTTQREETAKKAVEVGAIVVSSYEDAGISGATFINRPGIQAAINEIEEGRANLLVCYDLSRLSRDVSHQAMIKNRVENAGGKLVFCMGTYEDTEEGELFYTIDGGFKQYERKLIRRRTTNGKRKKATMGQQPNRTARAIPYGYHIVTKPDIFYGRYTPEDEGTYKVIPEEAAWVREMFQRFAAGVSLRKLGGWLQESSVPTPRNGAHWRPSTLKRILENPAYKGTAAYGRYQVRRDERRLTQGFKTDVIIRQRPEDQWITIEAPAIVDAGIWEQCQVRLKTARQTMSGNPSRRYLLTGILRCPICKRSMVGQRRTRTHSWGETKEYHYHCPDQRPSRTSGKAVCNARMYKGEDAEKALRFAIREAVRYPEIIARAVKRYEASLPRDVSIEDRRKTESALAGIQKREETVVKAQVDAMMKGRSTAVYDTLLDQLTEERKSLDEALDRINGALDQLKRVDSEKVAHHASAFLADLDEVLCSETLESSEIYSALSRVVDRMEPGEEGFEIDLKPIRDGETVHTINTLWPPAAATSSDRLT